MARITTQDRRITYRDHAIMGVLVLLALLLIPLFGVVALALQFAFVIAGPALLIGAIVYAFVTPAEPC